MITFYSGLVILCLWTFRVFSRMFEISPEGQKACAVQCVVARCGDGGTLPHTQGLCHPAVGSETSG